MIDSDLDERAVSGWNFQPVATPGTFVVRLLGGRTGGGADEGLKGRSGVIPTAFRGAR